MMKLKPLLLIMFLISLSSGGFISQAAFRQSVTLENENFVSERIPLTFDHDSPIVVMEIGGKKVHLIVDTGADSVTVNLKTATMETLDVQYLLSQETSTDVTGAVYRSRRFIIPSADLGGLKFANLSAAEEGRSFTGLDGILGNELLKHFYVLLDYSVPEMVLYSKTAYPDELGLSGWNKIPFHHNNIGIIVNGRLGDQGKELKFCLDTGCTINYRERKLGLIRPQYAPAAEQAEGVRLGLNQMAEEEYRTAKTDRFYTENLNLGPLEFMVYDFKQPPVDGFIGGNVLTNYKVLIDFDRQVLFFKRIEK